MKKVFGFLLLFFCQVIYGIGGYGLQEGSLNDCALKLVDYESNSLSSCSATLLAVEKNTEIIPGGSGNYTANLEKQAYNLKFATIEHCLKEFDAATLQCSDGETSFVSVFDPLNKNKINFNDMIERHSEGLVVRDTLGFAVNFKSFKPIKIATGEDLQKILQDEGATCYAAGASRFKDFKINPNIEYQRIKKFDLNKPSSVSKKVILNPQNISFSPYKFISYDIMNCEDNHHHGCFTAVPGDSGGGLVCKLSNGNRYLVGAHMTSKKGSGRLKKGFKLPAKFQDDFIIHYQVNKKLPDLYTMIKHNSDFSFLVRLQGAKCQENFLKNMYQELFPSVEIQGGAYYSPQIKITVTNRAGKELWIRNSFGRKKEAETFILQNGANRSFIIDGSEKNIFSDFEIEFYSINLEKMNTHYHIIAKGSDSFEISESNWPRIDNSNMTIDHFTYHYVPRKINQNLQAWGCGVDLLYGHLPGVQPKCTLSPQGLFFECGIN